MLPNVTKETCPWVSPGGILYYRVTVHNPTDYWAADIVITDDLGAQFDLPAEYSLDGEEWKTWDDSISIDHIEPNSLGSMLIRGKLKNNASGIIESKATVKMTLYQDIKDRRGEHA
jgi:hypothetical protein